MAALVLTGFLASAVDTLLPSFVASTGARARVDPVAVATVLVAGSVSCMLVRILAAWCASRLGAAQKLVVVAALLVLGSCGYLLIASGATWSFILGAVVAYACGWGWNGLFNLIVPGARPARVRRTRRGRRSPIRLVRCRCRRFRGCREYGVRDPALDH